MPSNRYFTNDLRIWVVSTVSCWTIHKRTVPSICLEVIVRIGEVEMTEKKEDMLCME